MTIQGRIIRIIDNRTAIINLGELNGVSSDSIFNILGDPEVIFDPFTRETLGEATVVKAKMKAATVHERFTIATTRWTVWRANQKYLQSHMQSILSTFNPGQYETVDQGEMRVDPHQVQPWRAQTEAMVKVGDIVEVDIDFVPEEKTEDTPSNDVAEKDEQTQ